MKIGLWNIDHPEYDITKNRHHERFLDISDYLQQQDCDVFILTETNAAIGLDGYASFLSQESPFLNKSRCYASPNRYHQVGILSKVPAEQLDISEPINGVLCKIKWKEHLLYIYGNVITIKDQWKPDSDKKYKDRVAEQLQQFKELINQKSIIAGDFNLRKGWTQKKEVTIKSGNL